MSVCKHLAVLLLLLCGIIPCPGFTQESRITPGEVLSRASKEFDKIGDYQTVLHQTLTLPAGKTKEQWFKISMVKPVGNNKKDVPTLLIQVYDTPIALATPVAEIKDPVTVIYADQSEKMWTYKPAAKSVTIEYLTDNTELPSELLYIAGFLNFDLDKLKEKAYLDDQVLLDTLNGKQAYKVRITPRKKMKNIEPPKSIWIDKSTNMPVQLQVEGDASAMIKFLEYKTNQGIQSETLMPMLPGDPLVNDKTLSVPKPQSESNDAEN